VLVSHERKLAPLGKRLNERLGPNVLVYIYLHQISDPVYGEYYIHRLSPSNPESCTGSCTERAADRSTDP
jgi:hypothetical protein